MVEGKRVAVVVPAFEEEHLVAETLRGIPDFVDRISNPDDFLGERPGDIVLSWLTRLHFGRWRGVPALKAVWVILGLVPAVMFATGAIMWWNRVLRRRGSGAPG